MRAKSLTLVQKPAISSQTVEGAHEKIEKESNYSLAEAANFLETCPPLSSKFSEDDSESMLFLPLCKFKFLFFLKDAKYQRVVTKLHRCRFINMGGSLGCTVSLAS